MDARLPLALAAVATSSPTLGAEAFRSQDVLTRQYAMAALAGGAAGGSNRVTTTGASRVLTTGQQRVLTS